MEYFNIILVWFFAILIELHFRGDRTSVDGILMHGIKSRSKMASFPINHIHIGHTLLTELKHRTREQKRAGNQLIWSEWELCIERYQPFSEHFSSQFTCETFLIDASIFFSIEFHLRAR